jgi:hypothetical protein
MAEEGSPRGVPPPLPASRATSEAGSPPCDTETGLDDDTSRVNRRRATTLESHRDKTEAVLDDETGARSTFASAGAGASYDDETHETDVALLRKKLNEFCVENAALGEATNALRRALSRATTERAESSAAAAVAAKALVDEKEAAEIQSDKAMEDARCARLELEDVERLALELKDELEEARQQITVTKGALRDAENAAATAKEELSAASAMAESLRDALADAERDAETAAAKTKAKTERAASKADTEKAEAVELMRIATETEATATSAAELGEARAAAQRASRDRDAMATTWRKEWEAAKEDHLCELRSSRGRVANAEADLATLRAALAQERDARAAAETAAEDATARSRRATRDRDGAVASLRALAEHEDLIREDIVTRAAVVGRLRDDACESAERCETLVGRCAAACDERDAATRRAERAEADLAEMATLAETVAMVQTESARRRATRSTDRRSPGDQLRSDRAPSHETNATPSTSMSPDTAAVSELLRAAVRESGSSPNSFKSSMAAPNRAYAPPGQGGDRNARQAQQRTPASAPDPSTPTTPETPPLRDEIDRRGVTQEKETPRPSASPRTPGTAPRWLRLVGDDVAEALVHALAKEVGELRDVLGSKREEATQAKSARDDARRALVEETTRMRTLERARIVDLRETRLAEQRLHSATKTVWALRDELALAAVDGFVGRHGNKVGDVTKGEVVTLVRGARIAQNTQNRHRSSRDDDDDDDVDDDVEDLHCEDGASSDETYAPKTGDAYFRKVGARVFGRGNAVASEFVPNTPHQRFGARPRPAVPRATAFSPM